LPAGTRALKFRELPKRRRSLALHERIAAKIRRNPARLDNAQKNMNR
jgi:hypothetical protein